MANLQCNTELSITYTNLRQLTLQTVQVQPAFNITVGISLKPYI